MTTSDCLAIEVGYRHACESLDICLNDFGQFTETVLNILELDRVAHKFHSEECLKVVKNLTDGKLAGASMEGFAATAIEKIIAFFKELGRKIKAFFIMVAHKVASIFNGGFDESKFKPFGAYILAKRFDDKVYELSEGIINVCKFEDTFKGGLTNIADMGHSFKSEIEPKLKEKQAEVKELIGQMNGSDANVVESVGTFKDGLALVKELKERIKRSEKLAKMSEKMNTSFATKTERLKAGIEQAKRFQGGEEVHSMLSEIAASMGAVAKEQFDLMKTYIDQLVKDSTQVRNKMKGVAESHESFTPSQEGIFGVKGQHKLLKSMQKEINMKFGGQLKGYLLSANTRPNIPPWKFLDVDDSFEFTKKVYQVDKRLSGKPIDHYFIAVSGSEALCVDKKDQLYKYAKSGDNPFSSMNRNLKLFLCSKDPAYAKQVQRNALVTTGVILGLPIGVNV